MMPKILIFLVILCSLSAAAGEITVDRKDSLIRNELFDQKRQRAEQYKVQQEALKSANENCSCCAVTEFRLLNNHCFIYLCGDDYYQGDKVADGFRYRQLSKTQVKKLYLKKE